jgi:Phage integrase family
MTAGGLIAVPTTGPWQAPRELTLAAPDQDGSDPSIGRREAPDRRANRTVRVHREDAATPFFGSGPLFFAALGGENSRAEGQNVRKDSWGKGRKHRILTLWKSVADSVRAWLAIRGEAPVPELFLNARGTEMTRAGFEYLLRKYATAAREPCPSLRGQRISPHVLRHTCALTILQATGDIRRVALWLGHESIQTTETYLRVDVTERIGVLQSVTPPQLRPGTFRPPDRLIASLHP